MSVREPQKTEKWEEKMKLSLYASETEDYLTCDEIVDFDNPKICRLSQSLFEQSNGELDFIKRAYEFVRDEISHSADADKDDVTCSASEVLEAGHGICFAKSHLLAAILRSRGVPAGFCYQKLILDDDTAPVLIYHGLNGVYLKDLDTWVRLDARGNKPGVNAQFSTEFEQLAFPVRTEKGEIDGLVIYPNPDKNVLNHLKKSKSRKELWKNLPMELDYK